MSQGKRIIHVFNSSIVSGPETLVLPALGRLGMPVTVVFLHETRRAAEGERPIAYARGLGLDTRSVAVRGRIDPGAVRDLASLLEALGPAVAHAHDVKASAYLLRATRRLERANGGRRPFAIFSTHHGVRGRSGFRAKLYERCYARLVLPAFDRVLTVCGSDRGLLLGRGLRPDQVRVHLNGVDRRRVAPEARASEQRAIRERWGLAARGIPGDATILGVVGRIAPEKRLDRMLRIAARLERERLACDWRVIVFGTGPLETDLKRRSSELGLGRRVHWLGYRSGVGDELAGLDVLLSLSDAEGLPINLVEAGWAGTPVFATAVDGNLDLIPTPGEGLLVPVKRDDAALARELAGLLRDPARREAMGRAFQSRVEERFSGRKWLEELRILYSEVIENRPVPGAPE